MSAEHSLSPVPPSAQAAVSSRGGCLPGFVLPPLAVLVVGFFLVLLSLGSPSTSSVAASMSLPNDLATRYPTQTGATLIELPPIVTAVQSSDTLTTLASLFTPEVRYWAGAIQSWATESGLDANLLATVMQIESCGNPLARSRAGAMGLFQVMPYHFYATDNPYDPDTNALRGMAYLKRSLEAAQGDIRLALAGYNGGISVISRAESTWAAETQRYVYWGSGIYQDAVTLNAFSGASESLRLQEWLAAGGASLCKQARQRLGMGDQ